MSLPNILAFSSSRVGNSAYLENAVPVIKEFLGSKSLRIAFLPFAGVTIAHTDYLSNVQNALANLNHTIEMVLPDNSAAKTIKNADVIMVGGGNTFKLLSQIYTTQLLDVIRDKVSKGTPYIGWSAGSNITGPTICTTNDMPIVEPKSFNALGLFPFQINPHYYTIKPAGFNGETRDDRLTEFLFENPGIPIVCLPEGTALHYQNGKLTLIGIAPAIVLTKEETDTGVTKKEIAVDEDISWLM
jgi:dipeptidase E